MTRTPGTRAIPMVVFVWLVAIGTASGGQIARPLSVTGGAYLPSDSEVKDVYGGVFLSLASSYEMPVAHGFSGRVGLGLAGSAKTLDRGGFGGGSYKTEALFALVPVTGTVLYAPEGSTERGPYVGGGAGLYPGRSSIAVTVRYGGEEMRETEGWWSTKLGIHALVGYGISRLLAAEVCYTKMLGQHTVLEYEGRTYTRDLSGVSLRVTGRF